MLLRSMLRYGGSLIGAGAAAAATWIAYSNLAIDHHYPIQLPIDAARHDLQRADLGKITYYASDTGQGRPVLLVHSVNAASSSYEMRPIFEKLRGQRPVYALDLPGFGFSERSKREYSIELYVQAIVLMLEQVQQHAGVDIVALSLGCEFCALAALRRPDLIHSLAMISPTGFFDRDPEQQRKTLEQSAAVHAKVANPLWGRALFDLLVTRPSIRHFLGKSFVGPVDAGLEAYAYATTHQSGAHHAPLSFVSGALFTPNVCTQAYANIQAPVLVLYDHGDQFIVPEKLESFVATMRLWHAVRITPTAGLPHFEQPERVAAELGLFWDDRTHHV